MLAFSTSRPNGGTFLREARRTDDTGWAAVVRDSEIFRARIAEILERR